MKKRKGESKKKSVKSVLNLLASLHNKKKPDPSFMDVHMRLHNNKGQG